MIFAAPTSRFVARDVLLELKLVEKVPRTSWIVERSSVVISGCCSAVTASTRISPEPACITASDKAACVASRSTVLPVWDGVITNSPFSLVMEAFAACVIIPPHFSFTNADTFSASAATSMGSSTGATSRSFVFI